MDESLDQWPSVCQSDVGSTYQHLTHDVDSIQHKILFSKGLKSDMLRTRKFGAMMKSGVSRRRSLMVVRTRRAGALFCCNLSWLSAFHFLRNMKYVSDRKFTDVHVCQNYQNRAWFDKVIAKIKWCSFFDSHGMWFMCCPVRAKPRLSDKQTPIYCFCQCKICLL